MTNFRILEGKALAKAINGAGKAIATFAQLQHELAYGAVLHADKHNDAVYVQAVYDAIPANYRPILRRWFLAFGKVSFDVKAGFAYAKGKKSDMAAALATSPAEYERASKPRAETAFDEVTALEGFIKRMTEKGASPRVINALNGALTVAKNSGPVTLVPAKAKAVKAKAAKPAPVAPVAEAEKVAA